MTPFVVMVAGPDGSGKTTLTRKLVRAGTDLGQYINPDDIAATLEGSYDARVREAQRLADALRTECLRNRESFSFETVMSHPSKIEVFRQARAAGFRTILYFVATRDPSLNVERVSHRVSVGGHDVPPDKIRSRYRRTLDLLPNALRLSDLAFLFDNSVKAGDQSAGPRLVASLRASTGASDVSLVPPTPEWATEALSALRISS